MRKIVVLIVCGLLCGCGKQNDDSAKIDDLSHKLDLVMSNEAAISARLATMPTAKGMLWMSNVYYTNTQVRLDDVKGMMFDLNKVSQIQVDMDAEAFSNVFNETADIKDRLSTMQDKLTEVDGFSAGNWFYNTNRSTDIMQIEMESDIGQMKGDVSDMKDDMDKIKTKFGIY